MPGNSFYAMSTNQYSQRIIYMADKDLEEYLCECQPKNQHKTSEPVWRIRKITYDANERIIAITWANRSKDFSFICNQAEMYNYD